MPFHCSIAHFSAEYMYYIYYFHCLNIPQFIPTEGYLGCFQVLAVTNKAAINMHVQVFVWTCFKFLCVNAKEHNCWIIC